MFGGKQFSELSKDDYVKYQDDIVSMAMQQSQAQLGQASLGSAPMVRAVGKDAFEVTPAAPSRLLDGGAGGYKVVAEDSQRGEVCVLLQGDDISSTTRDPPACTRGEVMSTSALALSSAASPRTRGGGGSGNMFGAWGQDDPGGGGGLPAGFGPGGLGGPPGGAPDPYRPIQRKGISKEEWEEQHRQQRSTKPPDEPVKMDAETYRQRQSQGLQPEIANSKVLPSYQQFLSKHYPHLVKGKETEEAERAAAAKKILDPELLTEDELMRIEALQELERSQMPAVAADGGILTKTIEHYTFADADDVATFYVNLDKDLWSGASKFVSLNSIRVESTATTLEIRLQGVPVSERSLDTLAEWKLHLQPLFSRVEPMMTSHKLRNGKVSVKLCKVKNGIWKKALKY